MKQDSHQEKKEIILSVNFFLQAKLYNASFQLICSKSV